eukprot:6182238-Pleurochrysis_carterae.AAC.2
MASAASACEASAQIALPATISQNDARRLQLLYRTVLEQWRRAHSETVSLRNELRHIEVAWNPRLVALA